MQPGFNESGILLRPTGFHDGVLHSLELQAQSRAHLRLECVYLKQEFELTLAEIRFFNVHEWVCGTIIFEIRVCEPTSLPPEKLSLLIPEHTRLHEELPEVVTARSHSNLKWITDWKGFEQMRYLEINSSYGATIRCLFRDMSIKRFV
ncbi:MAG: hypothetical protein ACFBZ8_08370 [Opitutales bacterium]